MPECTGIVNVVLMRRSGLFRTGQPGRRAGPIEWLAGGAALLLLVLGARQVERWATTPGEVAGFGEAIDGDSLIVAGSEVRLKGVDAPEITQYCQNRVGRDYACGVVAKGWLRTRLSRGAVICRIEGRDRYGRLLGVCMRGDEDLNDAIVREGIAVDFGGYRSAENQARRAQAGLWSGKFTMPADYRAARPRS